MMFQRFRISAMAVLLGGMLAAGVATRIEAAELPGSLFGAINFSSDNWRGESEVLREGAFQPSSTPLQTVADPTRTFKQKVLKATYPMHSSSPASNRSFGTPLGGGQFGAEFNQNPRNAMGVDYYVYFPADFAFNKGGKLPGLFGGRISEASGGKSASGSFSTRLMWRKNGDGELYVYFPGADIEKYGQVQGDYGVSLARGKFRFKAGQWHHIRHVVKFGSDGKQGDLQLWVDNMQKPVLELRNIKLGKDKPLSVNGLYFSTFFGGSDASWGSPKPQHALFSDFQVWQP